MDSTTAQDEKVVTCRNQALAQACAVCSPKSWSMHYVAPDLIFVFRGPILRCSKGDLRAEVKQVVWHEVAHWLGYETEEQVEALGL